MRTTPRFENAVTKLYNAFHDGELDAFDCTACAVGNLLGHGEWYFHSPDNLNHVNEPTYKSPIINISGYTTEELIIVEKVFLKAWPWRERKTWFPNGKNKEHQFKGLCTVVEYLCELDGIPNVMDYTALFETEENEPKHQLQF